MVGQPAEVTAQGLFVPLEEGHDRWQRQAQHPCRLLIARCAGQATWVNAHESRVEAFGHGQTAGVKCLHVARPQVLGEVQPDREAVHELGPGGVIVPPGLGSALVVLQGAVQRQTKNLPSGAQHHSHWRRPVARVQVQRDHVAIAQPLPRRQPSETRSSGVDGFGIRKQRRRQRRRALAQVLVQGGHCVVHQRQLVDLADGHPRPQQRQGQRPLRRGRDNDELRRPCSFTTGHRRHHGSEGRVAEVSGDRRRGGDVRAADQTGASLADHQHVRVGRFGNLQGGGCVAELPAVTCLFEQAEAQP